MSTAPATGRRCGSRAFSLFAPRKRGGAFTSGRFNRLSAAGESWGGTGLATEQCIHQGGGVWGPRRGRRRRRGIAIDSTIAAGYASLPHDNVPNSYQHGAR